MRRPWPGRALAVAGLAAGLLVACARRGEPVATLIEAQGTVERSEGAQAWSAAGVGVAFLVGDSLRTQAQSQARLRLTNGAVMRVLENARIRFARTTLPSGKGTDLNVELGSAEVEAATEEVALVTALGVARVQRGARVRVSSDGTRSSLEVVVGRAVLLGASTELTVDQGEGARIAPGGAGPERYRIVLGAPIVEPPAAPEPEPAPAAPVEAATPPPPEPAAPPATPVADDAARAKNSRADVTLAAGDGGTLHVVARALSLRLTFDRVCTGEASVEVKGRGEARSVTGSGAVVLKLRPGAVRYQVRCADDGRKAKPRATGSLTIKHDSGEVPVSRRAAVNALDADGRRYTVLYQTRLPALTLGWAGAPAGAEKLTLHLESAGGQQQTFTTAGPSRQFPSGALAEGNYVWWYEAAGGRVSPKTAVNIRFDNAAPTAQFFARRSTAEAPGPGMVSVDGVTIDGAKVSAAGQSLPVDEHGRFRATVAPLSGDDAVAVRLEHPRTGVHYYVRHPGSRHRGRLAHSR
jgi:hypothetical protein